MRILVWAWLFRLPWFSRFDGYAAWNTVLLRRPVEICLGDRIDPVPETVSSDDLVTHELCHVWQMQHRPLSMPLSYLRTGYDRSPYERQAREAARRTRSA